MLERFVLLLDWLASRPRNHPWRIFVGIVFLTLVLARSGFALTSIIPETVLAFGEPRVVEVTVSDGDGALVGPPVEHEGVIARLVGRRSTDGMRPKTEAYQIDLTNQTSNTLSFDPSERILLELDRGPHFHDRVTPRTVTVSGGASAVLDGGSAEAQAIIPPGGTARIEVVFESYSPSQALIFCVRERVELGRFLGGRTDILKRCHLIMWHLPTARS